MSGLLDGQTAIVTGAGRGFGRAIAMRFAAEGARVALVSRSIDQLRGVAAEIGDAGGTATVLQGDNISATATASAVVAPGLSACCVGKAAQNRLTGHVAAEGHAAGIRAFSLQPGTVVTALAEQTIASPDARKWLPGMTARLAALRGTEEGARDLDRCAEVCLDMASGRFDILSGRYLDVKDDFEALLREARARKAGSTDGEG